MRPDPSFALLLLCFFLSGLAGLVYETAWTREFAFVFGTSSLAIATVLAAYMAGLAAGAAVAARFAPRITRPILAYGLLELGIALAALAIPWAIQASRVLYVALYGGQPELPTSGGLSSALFYTACSFLILMVPTGMMGATLPLLTRHAVRRDREVASRTGVLYAVNTAGAVVGTLVAAFVLLPSFGLRQTIWIAAGVNGAVFLAAWALARSAGPLPPAAASPTAAPRPGGGRWILPLILGSGAASFGYEVLWVRLLEHVLGGSTYAFASMLASFLMGIALGSALASRWATTPRRAALGFALAQLGTAALSWIAFVGIDWIPNLSAALQSQEQLDHLWINALLSIPILFPPAICIGTTFPFAVRVLARDESEASGASARVYTANTVGSIIGSLGASFLAIPWLGFAGTLSLCAMLNIALASLAALSIPLRRGAVLPAMAVGLFALALVQPPMPWALLKMGVYNYDEVVEKVEFFGAGRSATVMLARSAGRWRLSTNGLPEAVIDPPDVWHGHSDPERWMGALPVLARPELESMLLIGLGGGVTLESVPSAVSRVDVIELEPEVVAANRSVGERRWRDPLSDPRVHLHVNDARNALLLTERRFGAIVSQPSHPWSGGAAHLFTREFFELASSRLEDEGVLVQWMGLLFVDDSLLRSLVATLRTVFAHVRVYAPPPSSDLVFVASNAPLDIERTAARAIAGSPASFAELGIAHPEDTTAWLLFDEAGTRALADGAAINRDDHNRLQNETSRIGKNSLAGRVDEIYAPFDPLTGWHGDSSNPLRVIEATDPRRAARLAGVGPASFRMRALDGEVELAVARALAESANGEFDDSRRRLAAALRREPGHRFGRAALLRLSAEEISRGADPASLVEPPLDAGERSVVRGWQAEGSDGAGWAELDAELDALTPEHPLFRDAQLVRARWRVASGEPALAREALPIIDRVLRRTPDDFLLRARACAVAGQYVAALDTLEMAADHLIAVAHKYPGRIRAARVIAERIPQLPELRHLRRTVKLRLDKAGVARRRAVFHEAAPRQ